MTATDIFMWLLAVAGIIISISIFFSIVIGVVFLTYKIVERVFLITKKGVLMDKLKVLIKWFSDVRRIGFAGAVFNLGSHHHETNHKQAFKWYLRAAKMGYISAQSQVGVFFLLGVSVEKDAELARHWLQKASDQGCEHATWRLHEYFLQVDNQTQALIYAQKAAEMNYAPAYLTLGNFHEFGVGTKNNFEIAKMHYQLALNHTPEDPELRRKKKLHPIIMIEYSQLTLDALERLNYNIEWGKTNCKTDEQVIIAMLEDMAGFYEEQDPPQQSTQGEINEKDQKGPTIH